MLKQNVLRLRDKFPLSFKNKTWDLMNPKICSSNISDEYWIYLWVLAEYRCVRETYWVQYLHSPPPPPHDRVQYAGMQCFAAETQQHLNPASPLHPPSDDEESCTHSGWGQWCRVGEGGGWECRGGNYRCETMCCAVLLLLTCQLYINVMCMLCSMHVIVMPHSLCSTCTICTYI